LVISDAHAGLVDAIASTLPGAAWQRCRTHYMRNLLTKVPKSAQAMVATLVRTIFAQPDAASVWAQHARVVAQLAEQFPAAADHLADAAADVLAFTAFPKEHWRQIWSNNPQERLNKELRRRTDVVGIFPNREAVVRPSARCSPNNTTSGLSPAATWAPKASPRHACTSSTATSRR
jgi:transposase-like protein